MSSRTGKVSRSSTTNSTAASSATSAAVSKASLEGAFNEKGEDSTGKGYKSLQQLWKEELEDTSELSHRKSNDKDQKDDKQQAAVPKRQRWYQKGADYWATQDASVDGVLGGFGHVSPIDCEGSKNFFAKLPGLKYGRAVDCGAGIGRITKNLLAHLFQTVDLGEQNPAYVAKAEEECKDLPAKGVFSVVGLQEQDFGVNKYDLILCQWCLGHLPDDDLVVFFQRAITGLTDTGYIFVKENISKRGFVMDRTDTSITRTDALFRAIFERAGLDIVLTELQTGFPKELFPVRMYGLVPKSRNNKPQEEAKNEEKKAEK